MTITAKELKHLVIEELTGLGFSCDEFGNLILPNLDKETLILLHKPSREIALEKAQSWIKKNFKKYSHYFANGEDISPSQIKPILVQVTENWQNDLFRIARYYWSLPYSHGFGRRLRYIILDENNGKIIGIFGFQSPPLSFPARDTRFKIPKDRKPELVNQTMDIFTLGAIPPYNRLLGGKLIALAVASNEVREDYKRIYTGRITEMEGRVLPANLVALTTTSAYGRSSIYNRLKFQNVLIAESLGYTNGYGNFHLQKLYPVFKEFLESQGISVKGGYGTGPRHSWQLIRITLNMIGLNGEGLKHGIKREAFLFPLVNNLDEYLEGKTNIPIYRNVTFSTLSEYWKERWLEERSKRVDGWHNWVNQDFERSIILSEINDETVRG